jgi:hypothetical protein
VWGAKTVESCKIGAGNRLGQLIMRLRTEFREHQLEAKGDHEISSDERELLIKDTMIESVAIPEREYATLEDYQFRELLGNGLNGSIVYLA